jgi:hypothetical protein
LLNISVPVGLGEAADTMVDLCVLLCWILNIYVRIIIDFYGKVKVQLLAIQAFLLAIDTHTKYNFIVGMKTATL